ncbi:MAG: hypothetical protein ACI90A_001012, partial [Shewanella sp.]
HDDINALRCLPILVLFIVIFIKLSKKALITHSLSNKTCLAELEDIH